MVSWIRITQMIGLFGLALAQDCQTPPSRPGDTMPNIFDLSKSSYSFLVEANYPQQKMTHYVTEVYDKIKNRGKLTIEINGTRNTIVYFNETNEYFDATDASCHSQKLSELNDDDLTQKYLAWDWVKLDPKETIVGPSNMLRNAYLKSSNHQIAVGKEPEQKMVRGITADVWTWCFNKDITIKFYFSDKNKERPYGLQNVAVPLRVQVEGNYNNQQIQEYYEFVGLRLDIPASELNLLITIPFTVGCERQTDNVKQIPNFDNKSARFEAELVYIPYVKNSPGFTYISDFKITLDMPTMMVAVEYAPWRTHADSEMAKPGDERQVVLDIMNGFLFNKDVSQGVCEQSNADRNLSMLTLPDGFTIDFGGWDLFFLTSSSDDYHYLGDTVERGIPVSVFEKSTFNYETMESLIVTRYYAADGIVVENELHQRNAPLKVVLWRTDLDQNEFIGKLVLNIYDYRSVVTKKNEAFDVTSCFSAKDESMWFQMVFPLDGVKASEMIPLVPILSADYEALLGVIGGELQPYRMPKLLVDVDQDNLYLTGLLLERPNYMLDFKKQDSMNFKNGLKDTRTVGVKSLYLCAKECLENPVCTYFSHCGALCTIAEIKTSLMHSDTEVNNDCSLFQNLRPDAGFGTIDEISKFLNVAVLTGNVVFSLPQGDLKATLYRGNLAFGINGLEERPDVGKEGERFTPFKLGFRMAVEDVDVGRNPGPMSQESCTYACAEKESCQSFSYCEASQECLLSTKHGEEIKSFTASSQCGTYIRSYTDWFTELPGLTLNIGAKKVVDTAEPESCARACLKETEFDCKSFDLCISSGTEPACQLHEQHFSEQTESIHINKNVYCGHYSRKYLLDFVPKLHKDLSKSGSGVPISNVTAEGCAKMCRDNVGFQCKAFDYCLDPFSGTPTCTLRKDFQDSRMTDQAACDIYVPKGSGSK